MMRLLVLLYFCLAVSIQAQSFDDPSTTESQPEETAVNADDAPPEEGEIPDYGDATEHDSYEDTESSHDRNHDGKSDDRQYATYDENNYEGFTDNDHEPSPYGDDDTPNHDSYGDHDRDEENDNEEEMIGQFEQDVSEQQEQITHDTETTCNDYFDASHQRRTVDLDPIQTPAQSLVQEPYYQDLSTVLEKYRFQLENTQVGTVQTISNSNKPGHFHFVAREENHSLSFDEQIVRGDGFVQYIRETFETTLNNDVGKHTRHCVDVRQTNFPDVHFYERKKNDSQETLYLNPTDADAYAITIERKYSDDEDAVKPDNEPDQVVPDPESTKYNDPFTGNNDFDNNGQENIVYVFDHDDTPVRVTVNAKRLASKAPHPTQHPDAKSPQQLAMQTRILKELATMRDNLKRLAQDISKKNRALSRSQERLKKLIEKIDRRMETIKPLPAIETVPTATPNPFAIIAVPPSKTQKNTPVVTSPTTQKLIDDQINAGLQSFAKKLSKEQRQKMGSFLGRYADYLSTVSGTKIGQRLDQFARAIFNNNVPPPNPFPIARLKSNSHSLADEHGHFIGEVMTDIVELLSELHHEGYQRQSLMLAAGFVQFDYWLTKNDAPLSEAGMLFAEIVISFVAPVEIPVSDALNNRIELDEVAKGAVIGFLVGELIKKINPAKRAVNLGKKAKKLHEIVRPVVGELIEKARNKIPGKTILRDTLKKLDSLVKGWQAKWKRTRFKKKTGGSSGRERIRASEDDLRAISRLLTGNLDKGLDNLVIHGGIKKIIKISDGHIILKGSKAKQFSSKGAEFEEFVGMTFDGKINQPNVIGSTGGRDFDLMCDTWWAEVKSGWYSIIRTPKKLAKFKADMGIGLKIAKENNVDYKVISNGPIPDEIKNYLDKKSIQYIEFLE